MDKIKINNQKVNTYLDLIIKSGGRPYIVGGYVRDTLLNNKPYDIDIEVYGLTFEQLKEIFKDEANIQGNFGVFTLKGTNCEFSIPRQENKIGVKHVDFQINMNPYLNLQEAAKRRDITINTIMYDIINTKIVDNYNGVVDLENKIIKSASSKFNEDALRVMRVIRFSFKLGFDIDIKTIEVCKQMLDELKYISASRKYQELEKMITSNYYQVGFKYFYIILKDYIGITINLENWNKLVEKMIFAKTVITNENSKNKNIIIFSILFNGIGLSDERKTKVLNDFLINKKEKKIIKELGEIKKVQSAYNQYDIQIAATYTYITENEVLLSDEYTKYYQSELEKFEYYSELKQLYNGNYFIAKGFKGKEISEMQKELIEKKMKEKYGSDN